MQPTPPAAAGPRRRRILYLLQMHWNWIKQRPHFLAEGLAQCHDLLILHRAGSGKPDQLTSNPSSLPRVPLLPLPWRWRKIRWMTNELQRFWVLCCAKKFKADLIWVGHPILLDAIAPLTTRLQVVYDCMDDVLSFPIPPATRAVMEVMERRLVKQAAAVLCSSERLREILVDRCGKENEGKVFVVRNGLDSALIGHNCHQLASKMRSDIVKFGYFGTIGDWLDFDMLLSVLDQNPAFEFHLTGPVVTKRVPNHSRLKLHRPVAHSSLPSLAANFDAFLMPFRLAQLTEAVDPVKLYEYVAFGKEIFAPRYQEIERFSDLVHLYGTANEFSDLLSRFAEARLVRKNVRSRAHEFLLANTWASRCSAICKILAALDERPAN